MRISSRFNDRFERRRALAAEYGLDITEWERAVPLAQPVQRVERSIRMRIRFWCHHCNTQYLNSRVCSRCSHQRCDRCTRQPPKRPRPRVRLAGAARSSNAPSVENLHARSIPEAAASPLPVMATPTISQAYANGHHPSFPRTEAFAVLQQQSLPTSARPDPTPQRIAKPSRVRVHYICHQCQRTFSRGDSACSACGHSRCKDCPRNPPRRRHVGSRSRSRQSFQEHPRLAVRPGPDEGGDEFVTEVVQDAPTSPTSTTRDGRVPEEATSRPCRVPLDTSANGGHVDVTPPEPAPPI